MTYLDSKNSAILIKICFLIACCVLSACATHAPFYGNKLDEIHAESIGRIDPNNIDFELFLVGDMGVAPNTDQPADMVQLIKNQLNEESRSQSIIMLGNSVGKQGVPDEETPFYNMAEQELKTCIREFKKKTENIFFIPGNNEWWNGRHYTVDAIMNAENFIENTMGEANIVRPSNGCGEPQVVELGEDLILILIDSQWLLQGDKSEERQRSGCDIDNELEFVTALQDILARNKRKNVVIAAHHPVFSNGKTGGNYPLSQHFIPLPIIGTGIVAGKQLMGTSQQFGHPNYETYRAAMLNAMSNFEGVITVSGHEHNLEYKEHNGNHFVVSGSGSRVGYQRKSQDLGFGYMKQGFAKITHTKDMELWLEFYVHDPGSLNQVKIVYQKLLHKKEFIDFDDKKKFISLDSLPTTFRAEASKRYDKHIIGMGQMYRKEWGQEVELPVLLLDSIGGGLKPVQQGGGFQTQSLRLQDPDGKQHVLRTIDKNVSKVVPVQMRETFIKSLIQDGIAAAHPYAAGAVPKLAESIGIYHTNPRFVWLPHQEALGDYDTDFAEKAYLFEERPGGNTAEYPTFGGTKKTINTAKLIGKVEKNYKHVVDQYFTLKSRLLDVLIGDWDRHDDQWRWGLFKDSIHPEVTVYRPIPRDRDQAFFKNDGFLNQLASRPWFNPALRKFDEDIDYVEGLVWSGRFFDRHFLSQMTRDDFIRAAKEIQDQLDDNTIEDAVNDLPKEIFGISGPTIIKNLKKRKADLVQYAITYYEHLALGVTALGTRGTNVFELIALKNDTLAVSVFHLSKKGNKHLIWQRKLLETETKELLLYGMKGDDVFLFQGAERSRIKIRVIGGGGKDSVLNQAQHLNIRVYDRPEGMALSGNRIKSRISNQQGVNHYERKAWKLNRSFQFPMLTFYTDEGLGFSYNIWWKKQGFRSNPYKSNNTLSLSYFAMNNAIVGKYNGHFPNLFGRDWGLRVNIKANGPTFTQFFYGLQNAYVDYQERFPESGGESRIRFHIVRGTQAFLNPSIEKKLGNSTTLSFTPLLEYTNIEDSASSNKPQRFIYSPEAQLTTQDFGAKLYTGLGISLVSQRLNSTTIPTRGFKFKTGFTFRQGLVQNKFSNLNAHINLATYVPLGPQHLVVIASNAGAAITFGDYEFFQANYLTSPSRLRGFRLNRFAGDAMVYHANDLRIKVLDGKGPFKTSIGIFGAFDYGRVFLKEENNNQWHYSFGGGIILTPLNLLGFKIGYFQGENDNQILVGGSLFFN